MRTVAALLVMFLMPLFIPVLPVPGMPGLLAGFLGGYLAGSAGRAVLLALLPALLFAFALAAAGFGVGLPLIGAAIAGIALVWLAIEQVALLIGAFIGGAVAWRREGRYEVDGRMADR
jgi:hypothetical protein